ncbi:MAG: hypothetical protein QW253_00020 [Metallosphaera sp.]
MSDFDPDECFKIAIKIFKTLENGNITFEEFITSLPLVIATASLLANKPEEYIDDLFLTVKSLVKIGKKVLPIGGHQ